MSVSVAVDVLGAFSIHCSGRSAVLCGFICESFAEESDELLGKNAAFAVGKRCPVSVTLSAFPLAKLTLVGGPLESPRNTTQVTVSALRKQRDTGQTRGRGVRIDTLAGPLGGLVLLNEHPSHRIHRARSAIKAWLFAMALACGSAND